MLSSRSRIEVAGCLCCSVAIFADAILWKRSFVSFYERLVTLIGEVIADGKKQGLFDDVREDLVANAIVAFVEGIGLQAFIRGKSAANFTETFDFVMAIFMRLLNKVPKDKQMTVRGKRALRSA